MQAPVSKRRRFLSRPEWMVLGGLFLLVVSTVIPGWWWWQQQQQLSMARADLRVLVESAQRYNREYGSWPGAASSPVQDIRFGVGLSNARVMNILRALEGPGNENHAGNEQQIVFLEVKPYRVGWSGLDEGGVFLDPWGTPYQIVFDSNFDNVCEVANSIYGRLIGQGLAIWSCGPDQRSDTADDLLAWKLSSALAP